MPEHHDAVEGEQALGLSAAACGRLRDSQTLCSPPLEGAVAGRIGRRHEQQTPRVTRQPREPSREALLDPVGEREQAGQPESARELWGRQASRQLQECKWIAVRLDHDALQHALVEARRQDRVEQRSRIAVAERLDAELGEARERVDRLPSREDDHDLLRQQATRHEREHARRGAVEPLRIIDETEKRLLFSHLRQQVEDREPDEKRIRRPSRAQAKRNFHRLSLRIRQVLDEIEARRAQLLERREREFHLPFDSVGASDPEVRSRPNRILEQGGLADARVPVYDEDAAVAVPRGSQQAVEPLALALPAKQLHCGRSRRDPESMPLGSHTAGFLDAIPRPARQDSVDHAARKGDTVTTAIIGVGNIGSTLARDLVAGGESVALAAKEEANAESLANELGLLARAASVEDAIAAADAVVFAVWLDTTKELIARHARLLEGKVVVDPSNPLGFDKNGQMIRTLPDDQSAGAIVASLLPASAHYVKAFGTLAGDSFTSSANREPRRAVLFYATDDDAATTTIERLIHATGFDPLKVGGVGAARRIEMPGGDLHQFGLNGKILDLEEARSTVAAAEVQA